MNSYRLLIRFLFLLFPMVLISCMCAAQVKDTLAAAVYRQKMTSFILPAVFIGYGLISIAGKNPIRTLDLTTKNELQEDHPLFAAHVDNYLQFSPAAIVFGMNMLGIKGKNGIGNAIGIYVMSMSIMTGSVKAVKHITKRERPDQSTFNSFPSGHTATVFASAELLKQEYGGRYPWISYTGYAIATGTGVLRMYNNRHWLSDVVAGAGFGILSTKLTYVLYPKVGKLLFGRKASTFSFTPSFRNGESGFYLRGSF